MKVTIGSALTLRWSGGMPRDSSASYALTTSPRAAPSPAALRSCPGAGTEFSRRGRSPRPDSLLPRRSSPQLFTRFGIRSLGDEALAVAQADTGRGRRRLQRRPLRTLCGIGHRRDRARLSRLADHDGAAPRASEAQNPRRRHSVRSSGTCRSCPPASTPS